MRSFPERKVGGMRRERGERGGEKGIKIGGVGKIMRLGKCKMK